MKILFCSKQLAMRLLITAMFFIGIFAKIQAQPCNTPAAGFSCEDAPILCKLSDLDGYCTTLPDFPNPTGPNPLCSNGGGGVFWADAIRVQPDCATVLLHGSAVEHGGEFNWRRAAGDLAKVFAIAFLE